MNNAIEATLPKYYGNFRAVDNASLEVKEIKAIGFLEPK
jgi:ABC-type uncharacterized transport system ATPase subunit